MPWIPFSSKALRLVLIAFVLWLPGADEAWAQKKFPRSRDAVNDFASVLSARSQAVMENLCREILQKTGTAVVVATIASIGDDDPAMYANELYEQWGIGKKGEDKGVLIFLALEERQVRIETGYGVEGILPDGLAGGILDQYVVPLLKQGQYDQGLMNAVMAMGRVIAEDAGVQIGQGYRPTASTQQRTGRRGGGIFSLLFFVFLIIVMSSRRNRGMLPLLLLMGMTGRGSGFGGGGGFSGGFGGFGGGLSGGGGAGRGF